MTELEEQSKSIFKLLDQQRSIYENYSRKHYLQGRSFQILLWIYYNPNGVSQKFLVEKTLATKQVVNTTIKNWLKKNYIILKADPADRRQKLVLLTEEGKQLVKTIVEPLEALEMKALLQLEEEERESLVFLLKNTQLP
ncbi:MarR family transcriptional regulator [Streptococcus didelphis]|uniref:MarR family transcriptional regulator n=1 Tax=Streptococcus didelphis TaxID=102886 RepID=A0ABY9LHH7_9STRE|nr:helix-turn-helix domain-containing protein [Streptococcus didelphis]WMB28298.1 MarR family transcriptional regulator [Streptococcus didelphis]